jgi:hypothetical protein
LTARPGPVSIQVQTARFLQAKPSPSARRKMDRAPRGET